VQVGSCSRVKWDNSGFDMIAVGKSAGGGGLEFKVLSCASVPVRFGIILKIWLNW